MSSTAESFTIFAVLRISSANNANRHESRRKLAKIRVIRGGFRQRLKKFKDSGEPHLHRFAFFLTRQYNRFQQVNLYNFAT